MPGRSRRTTKQAEAAGAFKKNPDRRPKREPKVSSKKPPKPRGLPKGASKRWDALISILSDADILASTDGDLIKTHCLTWHYLHEAEAIIRRDGMMIENGRGDPIAHPMLIRFENLTVRVTRQLVELGLTPVARAKVYATSTFKDDEADTNPLKAFIG